jgi:hypothetical protein
MDAPKYSTYFSLDIMIHTTILFTFLAAFFFLYISKIEQNAFEDEISSLIDDNLGPAIADNKDLLSPIVMSVKPMLKQLQTNYNKPNKYITESNKLIKFAAGFVILLLLCIILTIILTAKLDCGKNVNITHIIVENTLVFIFVGMVEFWFFTNIAIKYIPTSPSLMVNTLIDSLKADLKP